MAKESANGGSPERRINVTKAWDEKKPATLPGGLFRCLEKSGGCCGRRLVLDLVTVFRARRGLLDSLACDVGAADVETFFDAAVLGFVFVTDTLGHVFLLC